MKQYVFSKELLSKDLRALGRTEEQIQNGLALYGTAFDGERTSFLSENDAYASTPGYREIPIVAYDEDFQTLVDGIPPNYHLLNRAADHTEEKEKTADETLEEAGFICVANESTFIRYEEKRSDFTFFISLFPVREEFCIGVDLAKDSNFVRAGQDNVAERFDFDIIFAIAKKVKELGYEND